MAKTKIVATVGPACDDQQLMEKMIKAGVSVFRFNMKHNTQRWHSTRMERVRKASKRLNKPVAILMDLQGPEVRTGKTNKKLLLKRGEMITFSLTKIPGEKTIVLDNLKLMQALEPGKLIFINDGLLKFRIKKRIGKNVTAKVIEGGTLGSRKGVNVPDITVDIGTLLDKDLQHLSMAAKLDVDFVALSFVRRKEDIETLKKAMGKRGLEAGIIAKIETKEGIKNFNEILDVVDGIMIARGDLGVELPIERVPYLQKKILKKCRCEAKPVITATEILQSMIQNPRPTRAEGSDVANAVYDGSDALMLSAETASGRFPLRAVKAMETVSHFIENKIAPEEIDVKPRNLTEAITFSAFKMLKGKFLRRQKIKSFVIFTDTGATVRFLSRLRPSIPILALTNHKKVRDQLCLSYGAIPFYLRFPHGRIRSTRYALGFLKQKGCFKKGERVILIYGKHWGLPGGTNTIRVEEIE